MIDRISLRFGATPDEAALAFGVTPVTVFVGPNYSGKSKAITEIAAYCVSGSPAADAVVVDRLDFHAMDRRSAEETLTRIQRDPTPGQTLPHDFVLVGRHTGQYAAPRDALLQALTDPASAAQEYATWFLQHETLVLNGRNRIDLVNDQPGGDLQAPPANTLQALFRDDELRSRLSEIVFNSFGRYVVVDPTSLGNLRFRLSQEPPPSAAIERGLQEESVRFHAAATHITEASDGAKAFIGILAELLAGDPQVLLMDEPEAFLHPGLAFNLGREVGRSLSGTEKRLFAATHSPQFLMGCIQSGVPNQRCATDISRWSTNRATITEYRTYQVDAQPAAPLDQRNLRSVLRECRRH